MTQCGPDSNPTPHRQKYANGAELHPIKLTLDILLQKHFGGDKITKYLKYLAEVLNMLYAEMQILLIDSKHNITFNS